MSRGKVDVTTKVSLGPGAQRVCWPPRPKYTARVAVLATTCHAEAAVPRIHRLVNEGVPNRAHEVPHVLPVIPEEHVGKYDVLAELGVGARTEDNDLRIPAPKSH